MYLGIDLGTSSIKVVLVDVAGKIVDAQSESYPLYFPQIGYAEQNPEQWYTGLIAALKNLGLRQNLKQIKGISFSGQMHGLVLLDKYDKVLRPAILWNDGRSEEECRFLNCEIGKDKLIEWTGNIAFPGFTAPKILWLKKHEPEIFARIKKIMLPKDYLAYLISGVFAGDVTDDSGTLYFDVVNKRWSRPMLDILEINSEFLPEIFESVQIIGNVSSSFAEVSGLSVNTKVIIGGGDQAVGAVGSGTVGKNKLSISLGTSGVLFASAQKYACVCGGGLHSFCHADGNYHTMGVVLSAAGSLNWWIKDVLKSNFEKELHNAANVSADNLIFLPYLMGERSPINDPRASGAFFGLNLANERAAMTRAVLEGVSFALYDCLLAVKSAQITTSKIARVIGGGAKSSEWLKILSDIMGLELITLNTNEGGGLGAAMLAMTALGEYPDINSCAENIVKEDKIFYPDNAEHLRYAEKFERYKTLYEKIKC